MLAGSTLTDLAAVVTSVITDHLYSFIRAVVNNYVVFPCAVKCYFNLDRVPPGTVFEKK